MSIVQSQNLTTSYFAQNVRVKWINGYFKIFGKKSKKKKKKRGENTKKENLGKRQKRHKRRKRKRERSQSTARQDCT